MLRLTHRYRMVAATPVREGHMTQLSRREALMTGAVAALATATPGWTLAADTGDDVTWDLTELFPNLDAWDAARKAVLDGLPKLAAYKGRVAESAAVLAEALTAISDAQRAAGRVGTYASLSADADVRDAANQGRNAQVGDMYSAMGQATAWLAPEVIALGKDKVEAFIAADATLRTRFDFDLREILRTGEHTLSPEGEALLASVGSALRGPADIRGQLVASDIPWPSVTLSTGETVRLDDQGYTLHRDAANRADRKLVFDSFWGTYHKFTNSLGAAYQSKLKADTFRARARRYPSALAASLGNNNIPEGVYRTLVAETNKGLPQLHRYFELRRRLLKLPDMAYYDIYPPLVALDRKVTLAEMRTTVLEAVRPLGPDYVAMLAKATAAKWMDPWPRPGKRSGAYMNPGAYDVHPYLLLNLADRYDGMSTYAHEWGHAMHSLLAKQAQPYDKVGYPLFLAEIASTGNEQLLVAHMLKRAKTREEKLFYLGQQLENFRGTFFRQAMFAEFELAAHDKAEAGEGLSGKAFNALYLDILRRYHGPKVAVDDAYGAEWAYIPHFYSTFYVYQYATCISAATYFAQSILKGGAKERDTYLGVLRAGGSDHPVDILKRAGLDMTTPAPYQALIATFKDTLDQVEALIA